MAETLALGRQGQLYIGDESSFGTAPTFNATDACRHISFKPTRNPFGRVTSPEKKQSPGTVTRFDRREVAGWSLEALLRPSGTLNTLPEADKVFVNAFGAKRNVTLSTTVEASPAPATTGATLASVTGLAVGDPILITVAGVKYVRWITAIATLAVTWAPALPAAPSASAAVKGGIGYSLTTAKTASIAFAHYLTANTVHSKTPKGCVTDQFGLMFGNNEEAKFTASGPAKTVTTPAASKPNAFTTVGTQNPPSGLTGRLDVSGAPYKFKKLDIEIANGIELRMDEYGTASASEILPAGRRTVTLALNAAVGDESVIYDNAESGTPVSVALQTGFTEGNIIAIYAPGVDFDVPDQDDGDGVPTWPFKGVCKETTDGANDELRLALM